MGWVRRHRRVIMFAIGLMALGGMTYGYLQRVGVELLPAAPPDDQP